MATFRTPLAAFAHNWIGGNIDGLAQLADTLYGYASPITNVASTLDSQVRQVVDAAGWRGSAAGAFTASWGRDSATARAVGLLSDQIGGIVGQLAVKLSQTEAALEQAADEAIAHGVPVGANGVPPQVCYAGTAGHATAQQWLSAYQQFYTACLQAAHNAREIAAGALAATVRQITYDPKGLGGRLQGDAVTAADMLGDLLAQPSANARDKRADLAEIDDEMAKLSKSIGQPGSDRPYLNDLDETLNKLDDADAALTKAKAGENMLTKLADFRVGDAVQQAMKTLQAGGAHAKAGDGGVPEGVPEVPEGDGEALGSLAKLADGLEDIPVIDVGAAAAGTLVSAYYDHKQGQSIAEALSLEGVSNFGGLGAAAAIGGPEGLMAGVFLPDAIHNTLTIPSAEIQQHGDVVGLVLGQGDLDIKNATDALTIGEDGLNQQWTTDTTDAEAGWRALNDIF
jgi:uncharacterized protein YukE